MVWQAPELSGTGPPVMLAIYSKMPMLAPEHVVIGWWIGDFASGIVILKGDDGSRVAAIAMPFDQFQGCGRRRYAKKQPRKKRERKCTMHRVPFQGSHYPV